MARPRAADHDDKRAAILAEAARLFAAQGFDRASMHEIAAALGVSKALVYHYYASKDALLADIVRGHLDDLVEAAELASAIKGAAEARLTAVVAAILRCYRGADAEHRVQINHLAQLDAAAQADVKARERRLVEILSRIVAELNPALSRARVRAVTMSMFGVLNWKFLWFRESGAMSHDDYSALAAKMLIAMAQAAY